MFRASCMAVVALATACGAKDATPDPSAESSPAATRSDAVEDAVKMVGYDIRRLRPRPDEPLAELFSRTREKALADGRQVAVLFSANWCDSCERLELELGNTHPEVAIGHVRILELVEEDWEAVTRMNEYNDLRRRWSAPLNVYPLFVLLDEDGEKVEEMKEARDRLERMGLEPTLAYWFESIRKS